MSDSDENNDDDLAPMVDGLSGCLCILILVSTVFMLSATDFMKASSGDVRFKESVYIENKNMIIYSGGINLSDKDIISIRQNFLNKKHINIYGVVSSDIRNYREKNAYNLLSFYSILELPKSLKVSFKSSDDINICETGYSCIFWE
ncbi:TPA: hypothetical protein U0V61_004775 [Escherichia coli]|nr:hypothetical protein [Escherichia marmotae]MEC9660355.1 hypothetical protein [Escherichia coli]MED9634515.1 hypothetical protein [Escherichia marmotae]HAY0218769.1 hypothetical protein [Escherichia coli]HAY0228580.1 hypothetical protein [Escherichia coli]